MSLLIVGLNHKTAPLEVREQLAFTDAACAEILPRLLDGGAAREALILSTCNRVEILIEGETEIAAAHVIATLAKAKNLSPADFQDYFYQFADRSAARHLFRVAASLDSMIIGETQILGQVKQAYKTAAEAGAIHRSLHKLLHHAFQTAKRVRTETRIADAAVSIASAAVEMSSQVFGSLEEKTVLLVGAGEMAELAAKNLQQHGARRILICNRTLENANALAADFGGETVAFENLSDALNVADIVICSTAAPDFLITAEMARAAQARRAHNPALYIDISVPRNIAPDVNAVENLFLCDTDGLEVIVTTNLDARQREAVCAEAIIEEEVAEFWHSFNALNFGETLGALRNKMQETARREFARQRPKLGALTPEQEAVIERMMLSAANQIAHPLLYGLRRSHEHGSAEFAEVLCELLNDFE